MEKIKDELQKILNTTAFIELHCCDGDVFSFSVGGKCITIEPRCSQLGSNTWIEYTVENDT